MLDPDTKRRINAARQILVGRVPDPKSQVAQITTALIYKFMDDMDRASEALGGKASFLTGDLSAFEWGKLMHCAGHQRLDLYTRALSTFSRHKQIPDLFRAIFEDAYLPFNDAQTLNLFLQQINGFAYDHSERLGDAFEYLLSILGSQGDAGQFRTPRHLIDFITEIVAPKKRESILDPACGTAGFLISAYQYIKKTNSKNYDAKTDIPTFAQTGDIGDLQIQSNGKHKGDKLSPDDKKRLMENIHGYDISPDMVRLSLVNMYLHGFQTPEIATYDALTSDHRWRDKFDIILANPPFMSPRGGIIPHDRFMVQANRSEVLFVDYIAEHLTPRGRAGIIVPEGIIFQSANAYKELRKRLVENWGLFAVVSLPPGVFNPYSGVKTSVLLLDKMFAKNADKILFVKINNDGFHLGAQRRKIELNDLPTAFDIIRQWQAGKKTKNQLAVFANKTKLAADGEYNLSGDRYRPVPDYRSAKWGMIRVGDVCEIVKGGPPRYDGGKKYFATGDIENGAALSFETVEYDNRPSRADIYPQINDVGFAKMKNTNKVVLVDEKLFGSIFSTGFAFLRAKSGVLPGYLYFLSAAANFQRVKDSFAVDGIMGGIRQSDIPKIKIPLPPLEVQRAVVAELDGYEKIIGGANQIAKNWKPTVDINSDWEVVKLGDVITDMKDGGTPSRANPEYFGGDINWCIVKDIAPEIWKTKEKITAAGLKNSSAKVWGVDSVIISLGATIGNVGIAKIPTATKQGLSGIVVNPQKIIPQWLYYILLQQREFIQSQATGVSIKEIRPSKLQKILNIPLPPLKVQRQIAEKIETERTAVESAKKLAEIYAEKTKQTIAKLWR